MRATERRKVLLVVERTEELVHTLCRNTVDNVDTVDAFDNVDNVDIVGTVDVVDIVCIDRQ